MTFLKKLVFKWMELGLGLKTRFCLETRNPIFMNFALTESEVHKVQEDLPAGFTMKKIPFCEGDAEKYWLSYNLYEIKYPKKELEHIRKARLEINTFVTDPRGRSGIFVFCQSPYVSQEKNRSLLGTVCDYAERLVQWIYGCGRLVPLTYDWSKSEIHVQMSSSPHLFSIRLQTSNSNKEHRLSEAYRSFNDISFFNHGRYWDRVFVDSHFFEALYVSIAPSKLGGLHVKSPYFDRSPDVFLYHQGTITYLVDAMNLL